MSEKRIWGENYLQDFHSFKYYDEDMGDCALVNEAQWKEACKLLNDIEQSKETLKYASNRLELTP